MTDVAETVRRITRALEHVGGISDQRDSTPVLLAIRDLWPDIRDALTPVTESRSYPYFYLARRLGVSYEHLLNYTDVCERTLADGDRPDSVLAARISNVHEARAAAAMHNEQKMAVMSAVEAEWRRRGK